MDFFYTPPGLVRPPSLVIEGDEFSHLTHVMRKKAGDSLRVVDGCGNMYDVVLEKIVRRAAHCLITRHSVGANEPATQIILGVGLLKSGSNFDFLVEKCVEIGVNRIVPLLTERTIPEHAKTDRWQKIALAAMKQSGRCLLPRVGPLTPFDEFLRIAPSAERKLILHEKVPQPLLHEIARNAGGTTVIGIGPEGGFSEEEIRHAGREGFLPASLGPRRLRTETAAVVATAIVLLQDLDDAERRGG